MLNIQHILVVESDTEQSRSTLQSTASFHSLLHDFKRRYNFVTIKFFGSAFKRKMFFLP